MVSKSSFAESQLKFQNITTSEGLISNAVYAVVEDQNGFIWFGTQGGLQRFDGNDYKSFVHNPNDDTSISNNWIRGLLVDDKGDLWVGTRNGINIYRQSTETFERVDLKLDSEDSLKANKVASIYQASNGTIWVSSHAGLIEIDPDTLESKLHNYFSVFRVIEYKNDLLLIGTVKDGLYTFDIKTKEFRDFNDVALPNKDFKISSEISQSTESLRNSRITSLFRNGENQVLVGTLGEGIIKIDVHDGKAFKWELPLPSFRIRDIEKEREGVFWIVTDSGCVIYNQESKQSKIVKNLKSDKTINSVTKVWDIFFTDKKLGWFGTLSEGVYQFKPISRQFELYTNHEISSEGLLDKVVTAFAETADGNVYIGTEGGQLAKFQPDKKQFFHYSLTENGKPLTRHIQDITPITNDELLVSTWTQVFRINTKLQSQEITSTKQFGLLNKLVAFKRNGNLIPFQFFSALDNTDLVTLKLNEKHNLIEHQRISLNIDIPTTTYLSENNELFLGDNAGKVVKIVNYDRKDYSISVIRQTDNHYVTDILMDRQGTIWIGTSTSGLVYSRNGSPPKSIDDPNGQMGNDVMSILYQDDLEYLWVTTPKGLSRVDINSMEIESFDESDGLQSNNFNPGALKASDGSFYFAGTNGFNRFSPNNIQIITSNTNVKLTQLYVDGKSVKPARNKKSLIDESIITTDAIRLNHPQNSFGLEFSAMNFVSSEKINYRFQLDGYDERWHFVDHNRRFANYIKVSPGQYVFRVDASNSSGEWGNNETMLEVTIVPPWWKTTTAYLAYLLTIVISIYLGIVLRTRIYKMRAKELSEHVVNKTKQLAKEKEKVETLLFQKDQDFANVSHEFRTPLTLILGPLSKLINKKDGGETLEELNIIQRNAYRLLRMVEQLLDIESFRLGSISRKHPQNFAAIIEANINACRSVAEDKEIMLKVDVLEPVCFDFTQDAFDKIILNLLTNAIKYTPANGFINVSCYRSDNNELVISVKDSGMGIAEEDKQKIFERFARVNQDLSQSISGAGIGLALVKELVEAHHGEIALESQVGKGTEFTVKLPIENEVSVSDVVSLASDISLSQEIVFANDQYFSADSSENMSLDSTELENGDFQNTILIIDDESDMRNYIASCLQGHFKILTANNGMQGIDVAKREIPDLIICDVMMPKLTGFEATQQLKTSEKTSHIPIILLTARADKESRMKGWEYQADEYLNKPFDVGELLLRTKNLLSIRKLLQQRYLQLANLHSTENYRHNLQNYTNVEKAKLDNNKSLEEQFLDRFKQYLSTNYENPELRISNIAKALAMTERQLYRKLKAILDETPGDFLCNYRLEVAANQLRPGRPISEVAYSVGFSSHSNFNRCFKAKFGITPSQFVDSNKPSL